jgi:hypothetical protein
MTEMLNVVARLTSKQNVGERDCQTCRATVNTPERVPINRFVILALSDEHGALSAEAAPPQQ